MRIIIRIIRIKSNIYSNKETSLGMEEWGKQRKGLDTWVSCRNDEKMVGGASCDRDSLFAQSIVGVIGDTVSIRRPFVVHFWMSLAICSIGYYRRLAIGDNGWRRGLSRDR